MQPQGSYTRKDIEQFDNATNWLTWQRDFYNFLFEPFEGDTPDFRFKPSNDREILSIVDPIGRHGKSKFVKYLCESMSNDIAKISFGSAQQLRSSITKIGSRKIYLIDLPRAQRSDDSYTEIFSVFEDVKNGGVTSVLFGNYHYLVMDTPSIIFLTNDYLPVQRMSIDRWKIYTYRDLEDKTVLTNTGDSMTDAELVSLSYEESLKQFELQEEKKIYEKELTRLKRLKIRKQLRENQLKRSDGQK